MYSMVLGVALLATPIALADDDVTEVPPTPPVSWKEFKTPVGRILSLQSPAVGKWIALDAGVDVSSCADGKLVNISAAKADTYRVAFVGDKSFKLFRIVVGDPAPTPPDPKPPTPPDPKPPLPVNALVADLKVTVAADKASATDIRQLNTLLYTMANESKDVAYITAKQLNDTYQKTRDSLLKNSDGSIRLPTTRERIGREIGAIVDDETAALTDDIRQRLADAYVRVADAVAVATK